MQHRIEACPCVNADRRTPAPRFPDLRNRFTIGWRDVIFALAGPAKRLHRYRNLRTSLFDAATGRLDDCEKE